MYVYGGPMIQLVKNEFAAALIRIQIFLQQGFSVLITDNMGTAERGLQFEGAIKHRLGQVVLLETSLLNTPNHLRTYLIN